MVYAAYASFLMIGMIWGLAFVLVKDGIALLSPLSFLYVRFVSVAILGIILLLFLGKKALHLRQIIQGLALGSFLYWGLYLQTLGLEIITASESGLITVMYVGLIPVFMHLFWKKKVSAAIWGGIVAALFGFWVFESSNIHHLNYGTFFTLGCACMFAFHIICVDHWTTREHANPNVLSFWQFAGAALWSLIFPGSFGGLEPFQVVWAHRELLIIMGIIVVGSTFFPLFAQLHFQKFIHPVAAGLLLASEMIFAGIFGFVFHQDVFAVSQYGGALIFMLATVWIIVSTTRQKPKMIILE